MKRIQNAYGIADEHVVSTGIKGIIVTCLGALLVVVILGVFTRKTSGTLDYAVIRAKWEMLAGDASADFLILGDSSGMFGVDDSVIVAECGMNPLNFCTIVHTGPLSNALLLKTWLETKPVPRKVVIVSSPFFWTWDSNIRYVACTDLSYWDVLPYLTDLSITNVANLTQLAFPLYPRRGRVADAMRNAWFAVTTGGMLPESERRLFFPDERGFVQVPDSMRIPDRISETLALFQNDYLPQEFTPSSEADVALDIITDLQRTYGFDLYFAHAPAYEQLGSNPDYSRQVSEANAYLTSRLENRAKAGVLFQNGCAVFPRTQLFNDPIHVTQSGSVAYTRRLIEEIRAADSLRAGRNHEY